MCCWPCSCYYGGDTAFSTSTNTDTTRKGATATNIRMLANPTRIRTSTLTSGQRTPLSAYAVGFVHGIGGSAGVVLLLSTIHSTATAVVALFIYAGDTAVSVALLSTVFGIGLTRKPVARNFERLAPILGVLALVFGLWYASGALGLVSYAF